MAKKNNKLLYLGILLLVIALGSIFMFINSGEDEMKIDGIANFGNIGDFSSQSEGINDRTGGQAFVFTGDSELKSSNYVNFKTLGGYGPYLYVANAGIETGKECPSGSAIRFLECKGTSSQLDCSYDLFDDMWYKTSTSDLIKFDNFNFIKSKGEFKYAYMCYSYAEGEPQYALKTTLYNGKCYPYAEVSQFSSAVNYGTETKCQEALNGGGSSTDTNTGSKYGYFKDISIPSKAETYDEVTIKATFVPAMDFNDLLIETQIDQQTFQPLSVVESDRSACDSSKFFASKFIDVKKGQEVDIEFTVNTGSREGKFDVVLYAVKGCYNDVGYDSEYNKNVVSSPIAISLKDTSGSGDWDNDGVDNDFDNCPFTDNPKVNGVQPDTDRDGVGDACDFCPLDYGIFQIGQEEDGDYIGCHPCEGKAETSSCWDNPDYDKYTDPRFDEEGSESGEGRYTQEEKFESYLDSLIKQAEAKLEEQCIANGGEYLGDGKCQVEKKTTPTVTLSDEEKCNSKDWTWTGNECIDPTIVEENACETAGGSWTNNECVINIDIIDWGDDEQPYDDVYYCGDKICSSNENIFNCAIDCSNDISCKQGDVNFMTCPDGTQIVGEVCLDGLFTSTDNTCSIKGDEGFIQENAGILTTSVVVILGILGAVFLL